MSTPPIAMDSLHLRLAAANALIRRRRTIKPAQMGGRAVEASVLGNILENANWAPTHGMTEPWRFKIFEGDAREALGEAMQRIYRQTMPPDQFRQDKFDNLKLNVLQAPVCICVCLKRQETGKIPEIEEVESVACAVQNMHLTASAVGMAAFWATPPVVYTEPMREFLKLGPKDQCLGIFYLGWPREDDPWPQGVRGPVQDKLEWVE